MRVIALLGFACLALAQDNSTTPAGTPTSTPAVAAFTTVSASGSVITVAQTGSAQFNAINPAISFAQVNGYPTVTVLPGVYAETVVVAQTQAVTVIGAQATSVPDWSQNQVTISNSSTPMTINTDSIKGVSWYNINFQLSGTPPANTYAALIRSRNNAFYGCSFVSGGQIAFYSKFGAGIASSSYFEASAKTLGGYLDLYLYNSTVTLTSTSGSQYLLYQQGGVSNGVQGNSTVVFDSCTLTAKAGSTAQNNYLVAPNGNFSQAIWRNTYMGSLIYYKGLHPTVANFGTGVFYGEFQSYGPSAPQPLSSNNARDPLDHVLSPADLDRFSLSSLFANAFYPFNTTDLSFIDPNVLAAIQSSDAAQLSAYSATAVGLPTTSTTSTTSSSSSVVSTVATTSGVTTSSATSSSVVSVQNSTVVAPTSVPTSSTSVSSSATVSIVVSNSTTTSSVASSTTSTSAPSATCSLPASVPSTAVVVGPSGSCAGYNTLQGAISALPADSSAQYIYILAGTYTALTQVNISRAGATTFRGETTNGTLQSQNLVTIASSGGVLSSAGGSENVAVFRSTQGSSKGLTFYNINFVNQYPATANTIAIAMDIKSPMVAFYSCGIQSSQGTLLVNTGSFYFSDCLISGTTDFVWGQGSAYFYNSVLVSNSLQTGQTVAAQQYKAGQALGSAMIYDHCSFMAGSSAVPQGYTYLVRDYTPMARVAITNSFFDAHISAAGALIQYPSTANTTFVFANNSGVAITSPPAGVQVLSAVPAGYSTTDMFGSTSFIDTSAVVPFSGFASSPYNAPAVSSTSTQTSTATSTSGTSPSTTSAAPAAILTVGPVGSNATYTNVSSAISALPADSKPYTIYILAGSYVEQFNITRYGKVSLVGQTNFVNDYTQNLVTISIANGQLTSAGQDETTQVIGVRKQNSDTSGVALYNINFANTLPYAKNTAALAADFYGKNIAAYGCSFKGFQDTLLANQGTQLFSNCYIEGSIDFIWGFSTAYFHGCVIASNTPGACISAQSRSAGTTSGYVFDSCKITYTSTYGSSFGLSYLGRPYSNYSTAVYTNSFIDQHINALGWNTWGGVNNPQTNHVSFYEFNNTGPGSWQANTARASFATNITADQAAAFTLSNWLGDTSFIDMTAYNYVPSYNISGAAPTTVGGASPTAPATYATINAHPDSGTVAPNGSVLVDVTGATTGAFTNLTAALASLPNDASNQTIFIFPGTLNEQVPGINRPGPVRVIGYTTAAPGASYKDNTVTITFARGLSVSPLPVGHSDAETATVSTASNTIAFYNINIINSDNLDGLEASYVTLATSTYGTHIAFYACSMIGWQDTFLTGSTSGYQYLENSYVEGAIDFIWGYSAVLFRGCTIAGKKAKSCMTAQSRASSTAVGGYFFDQCLFTQASSITTDLSGTMYLGRPYSAYAKVLVQNSYLDKIINPSGWKIWSATDPRTDYITFQEWNNVGAGNWENNAAARQAFGNATLATSQLFTAASVMDSTSWIDMTYANSIVTPQPAVVNITAPAPTNITVAGNSTFDGTTPPAGAFIVSQSAIAGTTTYGTIQAAINAAPTDSKTNVTIFIYPGTYQEQLVVNKSGTIIFRGYSAATEDYAQNQVTIQNNLGIDTAADQSNSDGATVYATGNYFYAYNIDFYNAATNYATLGFAVKSSKYASLYACSVIGGQDSLEINGFFFAFKSYIEGAVDFVWGSGQGYFLSSTLAPNEDDINITADKRATATTAGGFVFDQCFVKSPAGYKSVGLGRPWNNMSQVAYIDTYLDASVEPAGWNQWSKSAPQTDGVKYGEYHNYGPGSDVGCRANFSTQLTDTSVVPYQLGNWFVSTNWINFSVIDVTPFVPGQGTPPSSTGCAASTSLLPTSSFSTILANSTIPITATVTVLKTAITKVSALTTVTPAPVSSVLVITQTSSAISTVVPPEVDSTVVIKGSTTIIGTVTAADVYSVSTIKSTDSEISTVTPAAIIKTTSQVYTTTVSGAVVYLTSTFTSVVSFTPAPSTKTSVIKASSTVQGSAVFDIIYQTTTVQVTGDPVTKLSSTTSFSTEVDTASVDGPVSTIFTTQTNYQTITASARAASVTTTITSTQTAFTTVQSKPQTVTSVQQLTITAADSTTTLKAGVSTISITAVKTTTQKTTTTLSCIPTAAIQKRDWFTGSPAGPRLARRAAGVSTETDYTTVTSVIKTLVYTASGEIDGTTTTSLVVISKTTTLKPSTVLFTSTSVGAKSSTVTLPGNTFYSTTTSVTEVDSTTTLKPSTTTSTLTNVVTSSAAQTSVVSAFYTSTSTLKAGTTTILSTSYSISSIPQTSTITSLATATQTLNGGTTTSVQTLLATTTSVSTQTGAVQFTTSTITKQATTTQVVAGNVVTITKTSLVQLKSTISLAASTITVNKVQTSTVPGNVVTVTPAPKLTTKTITSLVTTVSTVSKTAKGAKTCTA